MCTCNSTVKVLFGTDSHTCNAGAFGQFATGIGNTDASFVMGTGKLLIKSPASMQFALEGEMPDHLLAKVRKTPVSRIHCLGTPFSYH